MKLSFNEGMKNFNHKLHDRCQIWNDQRVWQMNGKFHRVNGPAIKDAYIQKGMYHSLDSIIKLNSYFYCHVNGVVHKINAPSEMDGQNNAYYYLYGRIYAYKGFEQRFYKDGILHTDDGPAIITKDGTQYWYLNGEIHREDGPAVIKKDGTQFWYINNKLHREDGPAVIKKNGSQEWYINNKLHREDGPAIVRKDGSEDWYLNGLLHREDGPAIKKDGTEYCYLKGVLLSRKISNVIIQ